MSSSSHNSPGINIILQFVIGALLCEPPKVHQDDALLPAIDLRAICDGRSLLFFDVVLFKERFVQSTQLLHSVLALIQLIVSCLVDFFDVLATDLIFRFVHVNVARETGEHGRRTLSNTINPEVQLLLHVDALELVHEMTCVDGGSHRFV